MGLTEGVPLANTFAAIRCWAWRLLILLVAMMMCARPAPAFAGEPMDPATASQLQSLLLDGVGFLVLGALFLAIGVCVFLLALLRAEARDGVFLLFGAMSLLWGLRFICRPPVIHLLVGGDPGTWALFTRFLAYVSAPPAFGFVWRLFGPGWRSSLKVFTAIASVFALIASALLLIVPDPALLIHVFNVIMLTGMAVIAANILRPEYRGRPELRTLIAGGLGSLVFVILENLRSLNVVNISFDVEWIGVVILYGALADIALNHGINVERKLTSLRQELTTARQIQTSILPHDPPQAPGLAITTRHLPMTEVGGDFFDFAKVDASRFGCLIADVSGHGVPAALVAAMVKVAFHAQSGHGERPAHVLAGMNEMLGHRLHGQFVTAGYACIDTAAGTMSYAGAGHPPLYIMSARRGVEDMMSDGLILGPFPDARYSSAERRLEPGDRVVMYTDGIVEAFNEKDEEFGDGRLKDLLSTSAGLSADGFADRLLNDVKQWSGIGRKHSLADDLTLIVIDVLPTP